MDYNPETLEISIAYKAVGSWTKNFSALAGSSEQTVYLDGPYGIFTSDVKHIDIPIVCTASGIWITPFHKLIENHSPNKDIRLIYLNTSRGNVSYKTVLEKHLGNKCFHVLSCERNATQITETVGTRLNSEILREKKWPILHTAHFYVCAWWDVIQPVASILWDLWVKKTHIDWEPFSM